jgi:cation transport protein ChaC
LNDSSSARPVLTRERILSGAIDDVIRSRMDAARIKPVPERLAAKRALLAELEPDEDVWVFGYGSLIWNPAFLFEEKRTAHVHGYRRCYAFWTTSGRGTPENPGLMLGLVPGGSCRGVAFRIRRDRVSTELRSIFMREMVTGAYAPRWVAARADGEVVKAITFVANPGHPNYAGILPPETVADNIWSASGWLGHCRDYLINTVQHLEELGIRDGPLRRILHLVERRVRENTE